MTRALSLVAGGLALFVAGAFGATVAAYARPNPPDRDVLGAIAAAAMVVFVSGVFCQTIAGFV